MDVQTMKVLTYRRNYYLEAEDPLFQHRALLINVVNTPSKLKDRQLTSSIRPIYREIGLRKLSSINNG